MVERPCEFNSRPAHLVFLYFMETAKETIKMMVQEPMAWAFLALLVYAIQNNAKWREINATDAKFQTIFLRVFRSWWRIILFGILILLVFLILKSFVMISLLFTMGLMLIFAGILVGL